MSRFIVCQQSTQCPDGYARTIWFIWDTIDNQIAHASHDSGEISVYLTFLQLGPRATLQERREQQGRTW